MKRYSPSEKISEFYLAAEREKLMHVPFSNPFEEQVAALEKIEDRYDQLKECVRLQDAMQSWVSEFEKTYLVLIEASKLRLNDKFMRYNPKTGREKEFKELLKNVIRQGVKDFYRFRVDPSFNEAGGICFEKGKKPAVGKSYKWWSKNAKAFYPKRRSRLGTAAEYVAFLGVLLKTLVAEGWSVDEAWDAVRNDSKKLGHYWSSEDAKRKFEPTGSRELYGFFDLANTCKILAVGEEDSRFWLAGGCYKSDSYRHPLADLCLYCDCAYSLSYSVGWLVLEG